MKILLINSLGYEAGGTETSIKLLKEGLIKKGHEVKILTSDYGNDQLFSDYTFHFSTGLLQRIFFRLFNPFSYKKLNEVLTEFNPDIVHLNRMDFVSPSVLFLLKKFPTVMTLHGPEDFLTNLLIWFMPHSYFKSSTVSKDNLTSKGKLHYVYHAHIQSVLYKLALKNIRLYISPSKYFSTLLDKNIKPVTVIYNGIQLYQFTKKSVCDYSLLYVGRLDKTKGIEYIIYALPSIVATFPKTTLTIVGEGIYKNELIRITKKLGLENTISFVPWQRSEEIEKFYQTADILVLPSIWPEPFGKVGPEAMSVGRPIIATRVGGIPEWLTDEKSGYLVSPKNSQEIAQKVCKLFSDNKLLKEMSVHARITAEEFSLEKHVSAIEYTYKKLLNTN